MASQHAYRVSHAVRRPARAIIVSTRLAYALLVLSSGAALFWLAPMRDLVSLSAPVTLIAAGLVLLSPCIRRRRTAK